MKKIKTKNIDQSKLITKSEYAKKIKSNPVQVGRMIEQGKLTVVPIIGGTIIHM